MKDVVEKEAKKENHEQIKDETDLTPQEYETALKGAYKKFVILGLSKAGIDGYADLVKLHVKGNTVYKV